MIIDIILISLGLAGTLVASVSDIKTREVPDWLNYSLIFSGFSLRLIYSIYSFRWSYFLYSLLGFGLMFIVGSILYYSKQWGGGDTKLFMALGVLFSTNPSLINTKIPFLILMMVNILIFGALYGVIYGIVIALRNKKSFIKEFKTLNKDKVFNKLKLYLIILAIPIFIINFLLVDDVTTKIIIAFLTIPAILYPYLIIFVKAVVKSGMYKKVPVCKLTEGDWVEQDVRIKGRLVYKQKKLGIEKKDIEKLIKYKIKSVLVKEGIPFVPPIFIGLLFSLIIGRIIFLP